MNLHLRVEGAPNAVYGNESIVADLPFRIEGRVTLKF